MTTPRLDILLYAHDGRGLGHASRTVAIGLALRRLFPQLRVLLVSGSPQVETLVAGGTLDWVKVPAYATEIVAGKARGVDGNSGFTDRELGEIRRLHIADHIRLYRPRLVLVDHQPQGKHKELLPALAAAKEFGTKWVLGVRGVVGAVPQLASEVAKATFAEFYDGLFWYGDGDVLGESPKLALQASFGCHPCECGYVSRLREVQLLKSNSLADSPSRDIAVVVSIPWLDEGAWLFLAKLEAAKQRLGTGQGDWHLFIGTNGDPEAGTRLKAMFRDLPDCRLMSPGKEYVASLLSCRVAVICGGYNSLADVLGCGVPAVVLSRDMQDREQQIHLDCLETLAAGMLQQASAESTTVEQLASQLQTQMQRSRRPAAQVNFAGAENAAKYLAAYLRG